MEIESCFPKYDRYHRDLVEVINEGLSAIRDADSKAKRQKSLTELIRAKASQLAVGDDE